MMTKATTITEVYQTFQPEKFLVKENEEFYVDLYKDEVKRFATELNINQVPSKSFLIAGQSGNGKSTVLNFLTTQYPSVEERYDFKYIAGREIFIYDDIDIVDLILMIGTVLIKDVPKLKKAYYKKLQDIDDIKDGTLQGSSLTSSGKNNTVSVDAKAGIGARFLSFINLSTDLSASYRINEEIREDARRLFKVRRKELIDLTNEIIQEYKVLKNDGKDLVVVIDDLEKKDSVSVEELFLKELPLLNELEIVKIITMPVHLYRNNTFSSTDIREFGLKLKTKDGKECSDVALLKEVVKKRLADDSLITNEAIDLAVKYSGANLRQLIRLINGAALKAIMLETSVIDVDEVRDAIEQIQRGLSPQVMKMVTFLSEIKEKEMHSDREEDLENIAKATKMELVFACFNGDVWYEINPIIENSLDFYKSKSK